MATHPMLLAAAAAALALAPAASAAACRPAFPGGARGWGVNIHTYTEPEAEMAQLGQGFGLVRMDMSWYRAEPRPGAFDFSRWDRLLAAHRASSQARAKKFAAGKNNNLIGLLGTTAEVAGSLKLRRRELGRDPNLAPKKQKYVGGTITFAVGLHVCLVSSAAARADARARAARQKEKADRREKARSKYPMHAD